MSDMTGAYRGVLVTAQLEAGWVERLQRLASDLRIEYYPGRAARAIPDDLWREVEILYTTFATPLPSPEQAPRLRWVQLYSAGVDSISEHPLFQTSVTFTTTSGIHAINMAEYVFTLVLAWCHRLPLMLDWQRRRRWPPPAERSSLFVTPELRGKTIGIAGYGSIGRQVARLATAFGMRVLALQQSADHHDYGFQLPGVGDAEGTLPALYFEPDQLHSMLAASDVVVIALPLTPQTRGMFDMTAFEVMKPTAFLVNIARGDICNEADLVRALEEKYIAGAALDVFHQEPLPADHPLWRLPETFISPHTAGLTQQYDERACTLFEENLRRYLAGASLYNVVDKVRGY
jgi:phosphoglycerate dehydrogenase-like enzyme